MSEFSNKPLRIAFMTTEYPTEKVFAGGLASYLKRTAVGLASAGHEPEVFLPSTRSGQVLDEGVLVHRVWTKAPLAKIISKVPFCAFTRTAVSSVEVAFLLTWAIRHRHSARPFDVIQAASFCSVGIVAACWGFAPLVTRVSSYEPGCRNARKAALSSAQRLVEKSEVLQLRLSDAVYSPSQLLARKISEEEKIDCKVVEPPVDLDRIAFLAQRNGKLPFSGPYALYFGSINVLKGCDRLLDVLPGLLRKIGDLSFVFAGNIGKHFSGLPFKDAIQKSMPEFGHRVSFLPPLRHEALMPIVRNARLVVLPSRFDNLPNTCLEAMALGRVVVATRDASFEQLIEDGANGFLVSQDDNSELADTIEKVWKMPADQRDAIGNAARRTLERLRPEEALSKLITFYENCRRPKNKHTDRTSQRALRPKG